MLRVFVSSTFVDLQEHRKAVREVIRQFGAIDVAMEHLGARDERPKDECLRLVREGSNAFVGIYAHRYGHVPSGDANSITENEYDQATCAGLTRFIYMLDEEVPWPPKFIDDGTHRAKLADFKTKLRALHVCKSFSNKDDLAASVAADLAREFAFSVFPRVNTAARVKSPQSMEEWNARRKAVYRENRGVFRAHTFRPSQSPGQRYDVAIYLIRHRSNDPRYRREDLNNVIQAEFVLGEYFDGRVFRTHNRGGALGIVVSAYGPFLCTCRLRFDDGTSVSVNRYIDFEMALQPPAPQKPPQRYARRHIAGR